MSLVSCEMAHHVNRNHTRRANKWMRERTSVNAASAQGQSHPPADADSWLPPLPLLLFDLEPRFRPRFALLLLDPDFALDLLRDVPPFPPLPTNLPLPSSRPWTLLRWYVKAQRSN